MGSGTGSSIVILGCRILIVRVTLDVGFGIRFAIVLRVVKDYRGLVAVKLFCDSSTRNDMLLTRLKNGRFGRLPLVQMPIIVAPRRDSRVSG